jgi:hypothetical protein
MKIEIEDYLNKNYYKLLIIAKKYTKNDDWASELLHEVILQLYDKNEVNVKLQEKDIKYYIIRMLMVNWCYPSSPFYQKHKKDNLTTVELTDAIQLMNKESEMDSHRFMEIMEQEFGDLNWFNKVIFEKYMVLGSLKKVAVDTSISLPSIGRYVKETRTQVKYNTFKRYNNE